MEQNFNPFLTSHFEDETSSEIIYFLDTEGLSTSDRQTLADIAQAVTAMNIKSQEGKPMRARLKGIR
jgi:hypothetical protein